MRTKQEIIEATHIVSGKVYKFDPRAWAHVKDSGDYVFLKSYFQGEKPAIEATAKSCCGKKV